MRKVLNKRIGRDFRAHWTRYMALGIIIGLCMYLVISIVAAAGSIIHGTDRSNETHHVEDGEFTTFVELSQTQEDKIRSKGVELEEKFSLDISLEDDSTLRVFKNREDINQIVIDQGREAQDQGEIVLEKRYCQVHDIDLGQTICLAGQDYQVVGIATSGDYDAPFKTIGDTAVSSKNFGTAFVTDQVYEDLLAENVADKAEDLTYAYRLEDPDSFDSDDLKEVLQDFKIEPDQVEDQAFQDYWAATGGKVESLQDGIDHLVEASDTLQESMALLPEDFAAMKTGMDSLSEGIGQLDQKADQTIDKYMDLDLSNLSSFLTAQDNVRIRGAAKDVEINYNVGLFAGVLVMILFTYVISVFIVHQIDNESAMIGTFYALGAKKRELIGHYITLPVIICFLAGALGTALGYSDFAIQGQMSDSYSYFSLPKFETEYQPILLIYGLVMPGLAAALVNWLVISKKLSASALSLMRNEHKVRKTSRLNLKKLSFQKKFQMRQFLSEIRSGIAIAFGIFFSLLILFMSINCYYVCHNYSIDCVEGTQFGLATFLRFPITQEVEEGYSGYFKTLTSPERYGYSFDTTVYGIEEDNPYFDLELPEGQDKVVISQQMRTKLGLTIGDVVSLKDDENDRYYTFEVVGYTEYSAQLCCFMNLEDARDLFGADDKAINVIFSDQKPDVDADNVYTTISKADIKKSAGIFTDLMSGMVYMLLILSAVIYGLVMYLMMNVMLERAEYNISLMKVFGYKSGDIRRLFLNSNFYIVAFVALLAIPLAKNFMNILMPYLCSNVAVNLNLQVPFVWYIIIYGATLLLYFVLSGMLMSKIKRIVPALVLKNRE